MDEIARGMAFAFKSKTVPIWVTIGMHILLDIQDILGQEQDLAPFHGLHHVLDQQTAALVKFRESWSLPFEYDRFVARENEYLEQQLQSAEEVAKDSCDTLKKNPIRCGLLQHDCLIHLRDSGLYLEQKTGHICMMAHLYTRRSYWTQQLQDGPTWNC